MNGERGKIRVLVVDDSPFIRKSLLRIFEATPDIEVVGVACDGRTAVAMVHELAPDVVTLDVKMPLMDGLSALSAIMEERPTPVVMLSSCTGKGAEQTLRALELGAVDFIDKCSVDGPMEIAALSRELVDKVRVAAAVKISPAAPAPLQVPPRTGKGTPLRAGRMVLIGTSTGGPAALTVVLGTLPAELPAPVLVVQHMPPGFTASLAQRLNRSCAITVKEAEEGELLVPGCVYIAPGGSHLKVMRTGEDLAVRLDVEPEGTQHRPSVDVLFASAAAACGRDCLAFVLTGMGHDGVAGSREIRSRGGKIFVEAPETSVVYGMPGSVAAAMPVDGVLPLHQVGERISAEVLAQREE